MTISPIYEEEARQAYREFFQAEFISQRLGHPGRWHGEGARVLGLRNPVQVGAFENLLHGLSADGNRELVLGAGQQHREAAWLFTFRAPQSLSVRWVMAWSEHEQQGIEKAHNFAVNSAIRSFEGWITDKGFNEHREIDQRIALAVFRWGSTEDQRPDLHTQVFFFNLGLRPDGHAETFTHDQVMGHETKLQGHYEVMLHKSLFREIGAEETQSWIARRDLEVTPELWARLCPESQVGVTGPRCRLHQQGARLRGQELFAFWEFQAEQHANQQCYAEFVARRNPRANAVDQWLGEWRSRADQVTKRVEKAITSLGRLLSGDEIAKEQERSQAAQEKKLRHSH